MFCTQPRSTLFPYTTLFRSNFWNYDPEVKGWYIYGQGTVTKNAMQIIPDPGVVVYEFTGIMIGEDRKSTRLNSSHLGISYAVFCLKKKNHLATSTSTACSTA